MSRAAKHLEAVCELTAMTEIASFTRVESR
jgi:hypothetical protein